MQQINAFLFFYIWAQKNFTNVTRLNNNSMRTKKMKQRHIKAPFLVGGWLSLSTGFAENLTFWKGWTLMGFFYLRRQHSEDIYTVSYIVINYRVSIAKNQLGVLCVISNHASPPLLWKSLGAKVFLYVSLSWTWSTTQLAIMAKRQTWPSDFRHTDVHVAVFFVLTKKKPTDIKMALSLCFSSSLLFWMDYKYNLHANQ